MNEFISLIRQWINVAIYVWGGQGQLITSEEQIRRMETSAYNADRAIALWRKRGMSCVCFDCSGLVIWALQTMKIISYDTTANGIYIKCDPVTRSNLKLGDFTFRINDGRATHIGIVTRIVNGVPHITEARGRDYGVVENPVNYISGYWDTFGKNPFIKENFMQKGDKGEAVYDYQTICKSLGYNIGLFANMLDPTVKDGRDGEFGDTMVGVTKQIQAKHGLPQTGVVDAMTYGKVALAIKPSKELEEKVIFLTNEVFASQQRAKEIDAQRQKAEQERDKYRNELVTISGIIKKYEV